jgi:hypothetical protein
MNNSNIPSYPSETRTNTFPLRVIAGFLFVILSCNLGQTQGTTVQSQVQTQTALQVQQTMQAKDSSQAQQPTQTAQIIQDTPPVQPTIEPTTSSEAASSEGQFTLTKSDGQVVSLPFITCTGTNSGEDLNISTTNTDDWQDRQRWEVMISGAQQGPGQYNNMSVYVSYGLMESWFLSGTDSAAQVLLENKGSGSFTDVKIVNSSQNGGEGYDPGSEYKFSAAWTCP